MAGRPRSSEPGLDLERIVSAAWALVDREGLSALSTRTLATELGVKGPALYWHVRNKQHLLSLMVEHALRDSIGTAPADLTWWEWLKQIGHAQRRTFLARRDSGIIASQALPTERLRNEIFPQAMAPLVAAGFSPTQAAAAIGGLAGLVLGTVIYEQSPDTREFLLSFHDPEQAFEFVLDAYVGGLRPKVPKRS
jgi:TetR/AcrR family tetracycline transcriptional repressor